MISNCLRNTPFISHEKTDLSIYLLKNFNVFEEQTRSLHNPNEEQVLLHIPPFKRTDTATSHLSEEQVLLYPLEHGDSVLHGEVPSPSTVPAGIVSELKT